MPSSAIARSGNPRRGAAVTALLVLAVDQASKSLAVMSSPADEGIGPVSVRLVRRMRSSGAEGFESCPIRSTERDEEDPAIAGSSSCLRCRAEASAGQAGQG